MSKYDSPLVVGCGGVGLSIIIGLKLKKIKKISAADIKNINLKKAKNLGANISLKFKKNKIKKFNRKFNKVFITTGSKIAIENAILCAADKSDIYFVGVPNPNDKISIKPFEIHNGKKFHPSSGGGIIPNRRYSNIY